MQVCTQECIPGSINEQACTLMMLSEWPTPQAAAELANNLQLHVCTHFMWVDLLSASTQDHNLQARGALATVQR